MKRNILFSLFCLSLLLSCKEFRKVSESMNQTPTEEEQPVLKVNATREDLCRIVFRQERLVDPNRTETREMLVTMLSDGSDERVICEDPKYGLVSRDLKYLIYGKRANKGYLSRNLVVRNIQTKEETEVFTTEDKVFRMDITNRRREAYTSIKEYHLLQSTNKICILRTGGLWVLDLNDFSRKKCDIAPRYGIPISEKHMIIDYCDDPANDTSSYPVLYDLEKCSIVERYRDFTNASMVKSATSVSEKAPFIVFKKTKPWDGNDTSSVDTLLFTDYKYHPIKKVIITSRDDFVNSPVLGPYGKWLYDNNQFCLWRVRIDKLPNNKEITIRSLISKSEIIYIYPVKNNLECAIIGGTVQVFSK